MPEGSISGRCIVVVGCQWGDEGKGKIVDVLAEDVHVIARYQGGANAGHTVHVGDDEFVLHQIPSGVVHPEKRCLLGNGVVLDVLDFFEEYDTLEARGIEVEGRVGVSQRAHLVMPYHRLLDKVAEDRAAQKIGTTGRGIGPAYEGKAGRRGLRVVDLANADRVATLVEQGVARVRRRMAASGKEFDDRLDESVEAALAAGERLQGLATDTGLEIMEALRVGKRVLLEGAQGTALDLDHGTYPFVTSSNTTAGGAATGSGIGPTTIDTVIGVVKAYTTRVGNGPLPTAFDEAMDERLRELGGEFGATTGRPRRCGWFDSLLAPLFGPGQRPDRAGRDETRRARYAPRDLHRHGIPHSGRHRAGVPRRHLAVGSGGARLRDASGMADTHPRSSKAGRAAFGRPSLFGSCGRAHGDTHPDGLRGYSEKADHPGLRSRLW